LVAQTEARVGLILGGGGIVGVNWELGVLAALHTHADWDPATAVVFAGTSAGSMVGAIVALGNDLNKLVDERTADAAPPAPATEPLGTGDVTSLLDPELMGLYLPQTGPLEERARRAGQIALERQPMMRESEYRSLIALSVPSEAWPEADLRMTTVDCDTGETVILDRNSGLDLVTAVAASCAVPTIFPPVEHDGRHFTDGPRGPFIADLATEVGLDAIVFVGPRLLMEGGDEHAELDTLEADGMPIARITGGPELMGMIMRLMDPGAAGTAALVGRADGEAEAAEVRRTLEAART
jgi:NTE family protein